MSCFQSKGRSSKHSGHSIDPRKHFPYLDVPSEVEGAADTILTWPVVQDSELGFDIAQFSTLSGGDAH